MCVFQIFCVHSEPNFSLPWQRKRQYSSTSSGFIAAGKRILTNAHCVDHHTQVKPNANNTCSSAVGCRGDDISSAVTCYNPALLILNVRKNSYTLQVKVRRRGSDTKFVAQVLAVGTECDIGISILSMHQGRCHRNLLPQPVLPVLLACAPVSLQHI